MMYVFFFNRSCYATDNRRQIELKDPNAEWKVTNAWFVRQKNMIVRLSQSA